MGGWVGGWGTDLALQGITHLNRNVLRDIHLRFLGGSTQVGGAGNVGVGEELLRALSRRLFFVHVEGGPAHVA